MVRLEVNHMAVFLKGNLKLSISPDATEAGLEFTPDKDGPTWSRENIIALLKEKSVLDSVNPANLENAIRQFSGASQGNHSMVIAQGVRPEPSVDSTLVWEELPLPESVKETAEQLAREAPPPRIYDSTGTKTEAQRKVGLHQTSGGEKADTQYRGIKVSPEINKIAYAEKGQKIAAYSPPLPGTPGMNIYGRPVAPAAPKRQQFYLGENISRRGNELYAGVSGIIRIGANWTDIIPHQAGYWRVYATEDGLDCLFDFTPSTEEAERSASAAIRRQAHDLGFSPKDILPESALRRIIAQAEQSKSALKGYSLCTTIEPITTLTVSEDKLEASLSLRKGRGQGRHLSLKRISGVINDSGLKNLKLDQIRQDILEFYHGGARELNGYPLARGAPPTKGEDGEIVWEVTFEDPEKLDALKKNIEKRTDTSAVPESQGDFPPDLVQKMAVVRKDERIASIRQPERGDAGRDVYGNRISGTPGRRAEYTLFEHVVNYGQYLVAREDGFLEVGERDGHFLVRVRPSKDARASLTFSPDDMQAFLSVSPAGGVGKALTAKDLLEFLHEQGVVQGLDTAAIQQAAEQCAARQAVENMLVARGQPPVHAIGERIQIHIRQASGKHVSILENGRADYKQQDTMTIVKEGSLLAEITPATEKGTDGIDVLGNKVPAKQKAGVSIAVGKNVRREPQPDGTIRLYAQIDGEFSFKKNLISVAQVHTVESNVDLHTGNVKFPGTVLVKGSVTAGFSVVSGSDITVENVVEQALLSADGSIIVKKGVKGNNKAILRAKGDIQCLFAEKAVILAVGDIRINHSILHCRIKCNSRIIMGEKKGTIIGGIIKAKLGLEAVTLGSVSGVKTRVCFGQDYLVEDRIELEEKELKRLGNKIRGFDSLMKGQNMEGPAALQELRRIREEKLQGLKTIEKYNQHLFVLREKFEEHFPSEVIVRGTVFPGVVIESHDRVYEVRQEQSMVAFMFNPLVGQIEVKSLVAGS